MHLPHAIRVAGMLLLLAASGQANAADPANGARLYDSICAQCHNPGGNPGPAPIRLGANNPVAIAQALQTVNQMAPFEALLLPPDIDDAAAYLGVRFGIAPPAPMTVEVVEYYHAAFDHYFVTAIAGEITKLDNGTFAGWVRTGLAFKAYAAASASVATVCRFFSTAFDPKSSHFYTASAPECAVVKADPHWQFEGEVLFMAATADDGTCSAGTAPVYRLYNNGQGAAPNHRFTTDVAARSDMLRHGWIPEGAGIGVTMCAPQ